MHASLIVAAVVGCRTAEPPPPVAATAPPTSRPAVLARKTYNRDFDSVFVATRDAINSRYPGASDNPQRRTIATAWHQRGTAPDGGRYFIRFDVYLDGPPWSITITGVMRAWSVGASSPVELHGAEADRRIEEATDELRRDIDQRLR